MVGGTAATGDRTGPASRLLEVPVGPGPQLGVWRNAAVTVRLR